MFEFRAAGSEVRPPSFVAVSSEFLSSLGMAVKMTALYGGAHPIAAEALRDACEVLDLAFTVGRTESLRVSWSGGRWFCNGSPTLAAVQPPGSLKALFLDRGLAGLRFQRGLRPAELLALCEIVSQPTEGASAESLVRKGVEHVRLEIESLPARAEPSAPPAVPAPVEKPQSAAEDEPQPAAAPGAGGEKSFGVLLRSLVEYAVNDPMERLKIYEDAVRLVKDAIETKVSAATSELSREKDRVSGELARTEKVFTAVAEGRVIVDEEGRVLMMNPAAEELAGKRLAELVGRRIMESLTPGEHMVALARGDDPERVEIVADGEVERALRRSMAVLQDPAGRVVGTYTSLPEVAKFKEALRLREEFLSRVTHDLQAPLSSICCALELLSERIGPEAGAEASNFLRICLNNSRRLGAMIKDILDFSKMRSGKMEIQLEPTSVSAMMQEAVESLQPWARNKKIELDCRPPEPDTTAMADRRRIVQVLANLVSNAVKFTPEGGRVTVFSPERRDAAGRIIISVRDSGCGIPPEKQVKIFEAFEQLDGGEPRGGVGLGLAIVKEFVKLHGGSVWVESEAGQGATFCFTLAPAVPVPAERPAVPASVLEPSFVVARAEPLGPRPLC